MSTKICFRCVAFIMTNGLGDHRIAEHDLRIFHTRHTWAKCKLCPKVVTAGSRQEGRTGEFVFRCKVCNETLRLATGNHNYSQQS